MLKRYTFWLWAAVVFQFLTAVIHSLSFIITPELKNDTERQLFDLVSTYKFDMGGGFHPTFGNLFTALSACFPFLFILGGLINAYLLRKKAGIDILKGILLINVIVFGACFVVMAIFTFLPPITLSGIVFVTLLIAYFLISQHEAG